MQKNMTHSTTTPDKRALILDAALGLLASKGFHGFSIKQLADRAGLAAGTVYLYFEDREDLIRQLHSDIIQKVAGQLFIDHDPSQPLALQYRHICARYWHFCLANPQITLSKVQFDHLPPEVLRLQQEDVRSAARPLLELFQKGRAAGEIKPLPDEVLASLGVEPYSTLARKQILGLLNMDDRALAGVIDATWDSISTVPAH